MPLPAGLLVLVAGCYPAGLAEPVPVVASFSILGDMTPRIGGDRIAAHDPGRPRRRRARFEPGPRDLRPSRRARVLVVNGLGFEGWMDAPRSRRPASPGVAVVASTGVEPLSLDRFGQDDQDPVASIRMPGRTWRTPRPTCGTSPTAWSGPTRLGPRSIAPTPRPISTNSAPSTRRSGRRWGESQRARACW